MTFLVVCNSKPTEFIWIKAIRNTLHSTAEAKVGLEVTMETRDLSRVKFLPISCPLGLTFHQNICPETSSDPHHIQLCCQRHMGLLLWLSSQSPLEESSLAFSESHILNEWITCVPRRTVSSLPWVTSPERITCHQEKTLICLTRVHPGESTMKGKSGAQSYGAWDQSFTSQREAQCHLSLIQNEESRAFEFTEPDLYF